MGDEQDELRRKGPDTGAGAGISDPVEIYAVVSGRYSEYTVHAIYRRREDAEARCEANNRNSWLLLDGESVELEVVMEAQKASVPRRSDGTKDYAAERAWWAEHACRNPAREEIDDMRVEAFEYYEGEPIPASLED